MSDPIPPFFEGYLPLPSAIGARGGPERLTEITALGAGRDTRNTPRAHARRRYDVGGAVGTLDELHALVAFFEARRGRLQAFRFRDPFDCQSCAPSAAPGPTDQPLGIGDGARTTFALVKHYGDGADMYVRPIRKPVAGTVRVAVGGVERASSAFSVDATTGLVTLSAAPNAGAAVTAGFVFDTPVRFDADHLETVLKSVDSGVCGPVPLIEVLG